jgi:hypothetical protein
MTRSAHTLAALAILAAGAVHLWLYAHDGYSSIHVIGPLFLLNGIAAAVIGGGLLVSGAAVILLAGFGYALTTVLAFVVSATHGLFGWQEVWSGTAQAVAGFTELAALALLLPLLALRLSHRSPTDPPARRPRRFAGGVGESPARAESERTAR